MDHLNPDLNILYKTVQGPGSSQQFNALTNDTNQYPSSRVTIDKKIEYEEQDLPEIGLIYVRKLMENVRTLSDLLRRFNLPMGIKETERPYMFKNVIQLKIMDTKRTFGYLRDIYEDIQKCDYNKFDPENFIFMEGEKTPYQPLNRDDVRSANPEYVALSRLCQYRNYQLKESIDRLREIVLVTNVMLASGSENVD